MTEQPSWMPTSEEIGGALVGWGNALREKAQGNNLGADGFDPFRALIRSAVEKALAEQEARWISALKAVNGERVCHPDFAAMWAKAEASPDYWAELLMLSMEAYRQQEARHKRECRNLEAENAALRKCLAEARLAMMEPHGEWKDVREAKALNMIRAEVKP